MRRLRFQIAVLAALLILGCEKIIPLSEFDFEYEPQLRIEADFFPGNLGKSVLRVDHTFSIEDSMRLDLAHIRDAQAVLFQGSDTLSTLSWRDSASSYIYLNLEDFDPEVVFNPDSLASYQDTQSYGGYKLDRADFFLESDTPYTLRVEVEGESYETQFTPYPAIELLNIVPDSVEICQCGVGEAVATYEVLHTTMSIDTARVIWPEDPEATFYTIVSRRLDSDPPTLPNVFSFPGPVLSLQGIEPGVYELIIGTMNDTWYRHYLLRDFPANHEARNFFGSEALGFAGTLNEIYLQIHLVPPGS